MKQLRTIKSTVSREQYIFIFLILVAVLMFYPLTATFNDLLTRFVISLDAYKIIQNYVVPWEIRMVGVILYPFGFQPQVVGEYLAIGNKEPLFIEIAWNCIGWQSLVFFLLTAVTVLQGDRYSLISKLKTLVIGLLGTFLVNLFRITIVALLAFYFNQRIALIFHDYGSNLAVIAWLFVFWWFAHEYVLEDKKNTLKYP